MTSFRIGLAPNKQAAGRFVLKVRRALQKALVEETDLNQSKVAEAIGVHRSVVSRELNGRQDITLGRVAELAWAMGREIEFELKKPERKIGDNLPVMTTSVDGHVASHKARSQITTSTHQSSNKPRRDSVLEIV